MRRGRGIYLAEALRLNNTSLRYFKTFRKFAGDRLIDEEVQSLSQALMINSSLEDLNLISSLNCDGLKWIAEVIKVFATCSEK